jgi:hypothetical protein
MAVVKRVLCPQRLRRVPQQFSWIDHRLVRDRHICGRSAEALALYLLLVTVADGRGLSYYSDPTICRLLGLDIPGLARARGELLAARLIAYERPLYQVLALDCPAGDAARPPDRPSGRGTPAVPGGDAAAGRASEQPLTLGQILRGIEQTP